jgi:adenylate cyclase
MSYNQRNVLGITVAWGFIGLMITLYDHLAYSAIVSNGVASEYDFFKNLLINLSVGLLAGIAGGSFLVCYINEKFRDIPYYRSFLLILISFVIITLSLVILISVGLALWKTHTWSPQLIWMYMRDPAHLKNGLIWFFVVILTQIALQVKDKFGDRVLKDMITGKYHSPREEIRIFMFVDIASSTSIAEQLTKEKYHLLLRDFYADITRPIIACSGEIYQYVGDEVVISWRNENGNYDNCLRCFFQMTEFINNNSKKYLAQYGLVPEFKAGVHYGSVIAGEVGTIKKDITFSGDVLNTTSRIQGKCNEFKVRILVSDEFRALLPHSSNFKTVALGNVELRGKEKQLGISTVFEDS